MVESLDELALDPRAVPQRHDRDSRLRVELEQLLLRNAASSDVRRGSPMRSAASTDPSPAMTTSSPGSDGSITGSTSRTNQRKPSSFGGCSKPADEQHVRAFLMRTGRGYRLKVEEVRGNRPDVGARRELLDDFLLVWAQDVDGVGFLGRASIRPPANGATGQARSGRLSPRSGEALAGSEGRSGSRMSFVARPYLRIWST